MSKQILNKTIRKYLPTFSSVSGEKSKQPRFNHIPVIESKKDLMYGIGHNFNNIRVNSSSPFYYSLKHVGVQPKLSIGKPNDQFEQEADQMAEHVMSMADTNQDTDQISGGSLSDRIQRKCTECEEEDSLRRKPLEAQTLPEVQRQIEDEEEVYMKHDMNQTSQYMPDLVSGIKTKGSGIPLPDNTKSFFESRFGHDFSKVRVHHDSDSGKSARSIQAKAYTFKNNIVFGTGQFKPDDRNGKKLIAHELTHIIQQGQAKKLHNNYHSVQQTSNAHTIQRKKNPAKPSTGSIKKALKAQKLVWDDLRTLFPNDIGKVAGTGFRESVGYLQTDFTEKNEGGISTSAPIVYVGSSYFAEKDQEKRKEMLNAEIIKIDSWRIETGRVNNADLANTKVKNKLQDLSARKKLELIGKLKNRKNADNYKVVEYLNQVMQSTPIVPGSVPRATGGFEVKTGNIKIIVLPDKYNSSETSKGAVTKIDRTDSTTDWGKTPAWKSKGGIITELDFVPQIPNVEFTIQTHYSSGAKPRDSSGYGVGTRPGDTTDEKKTLGFHEGSHGLEFIKSIQSGVATHKYPTYPFKSGDPSGGVEAAHQQYRQQVTQFRDMIKKALSDNIQKVDCVGKTIEEYHTEKGTSTSVHCNP